MSLHPSGLGAEVFTAGQFPETPRSLLPHPTSPSTPLPRVTLGGFCVGEGPMCHPFHPWELKTFDSDMFDNREEEQAANKYKNF